MAATDTVVAAISRVYSGIQESHPPFLDAMLSKLGVVAYGFATWSAFKLVAWHAAFGRSIFSEAREEARTRDNGAAECAVHTLFGGLQ